MRETKRISERTSENGMESENRTVNQDRSGYGKTGTPSQNSAVWNERSERVKQHSHKGETRGERGQYSHEGEGGERGQYTTEDKKRTEDYRRGGQGQYWSGRRPRSGPRGYRGGGRRYRGRGRGRGGWNHQDDGENILIDGAKCGGRGSGGEWRDRQRRRGTGRGQHKAGSDGGD